MLERFFVTPQTIDRIRGSWLGPNIEIYVTALYKQGYSARSIYRRVPLLMQFGSFTEAREIRGLDEAEKLIEPFLADWLSRRRCPATERQRQDRNFARPVLSQFFCIVARQSDYHRFKSPRSEPFEAVVPGFFAYLRDERGLRTATLDHYRHFLRRFEVYLAQIGCTDTADSW